MRGSAHSLQERCPPDLAAALDAQPAARAAFDALSYSNRQRHVLAVQGAKKPETRGRRVAGVVAEVLGTLARRCVVRESAGP